MIKISSGGMERSTLIKGMSASTTQNTAKGATPRVLDRVEDFPQGPGHVRAARAIASLIHGRCVGLVAILFELVGSPRSHVVQDAQLRRFLV
jgi:hypothetical protein